MESLVEVVEVVEVVKVVERRETVRVGSDSGFASCYNTSNPNCFMERGNPATEGRLAADEEPGHVAGLAEEHDGGVEAVYLVLLGYEAAGE